jgi:predicted helicase
MKLGLQLKESGYDFESDERLRVYLTNTLEEAHELSGLPLFAQAIAHEAASASEVKKDAPIMVVIGNPPYSGHSANKGEWVNNLLRGIDGAGNKTANYFQVDGAPLGERNPKWLNDDYVKFIRFSQWRIEQTGYGVLGFITNHGYLDNPTFRGMRQALMETFDDLYLLDLHGNSKKKEQAPDGSKDENVFDIQQGVAIAIFVKHAKRKKPQVHVADLYGVRESKYTWLTDNDVWTTNWTRLDPNSPDYLYQAENLELRNEYEECEFLPDVMPFNVLGFQSHRDHFAIAFEHDKLKTKFSEMAAENLSDIEFAEKHAVTDSGTWTLKDARKRIRGDRSWTTRIIQCAYRQFDVRWTMFDEVAMDRPRRELKDHVAGKENLVFNLCRQTKSMTWQHAHVSDLPAPAVFVEIKDGSSCFPLWRYPQAQKDWLDDPTTL